jgi:hypothetical protein
MGIVHYRNAVTNRFIGTFIDGGQPDPSDNPVECPAPESGKQIWNGSGWEDDPAHLESLKQKETDKVFEDDLALKAFALVVLDEINDLRADHGRPAYTAAQLKTAHRNKMDTF